MPVHETVEKAKAALQVVEVAADGMTDPVLEEIIGEAGIAGAPAVAGAHVVDLAGDADEKVVDHAVHDGLAGVFAAEGFRVVRQHRLDLGYRGAVDGGGHGGVQVSRRQRLLESLGRGGLRRVGGGVGGPAFGRAAFGGAAFGRRIRRGAGLLGEYGLRRDDGGLGVELLQGGRRKRHRPRRRHVGARHLRRLAGQVHDHRRAAAQRGDAHLAAEQRIGVRRSLGTGAAAALGAADADQRHRGLDDHGVDAGLGDLAGNEGEHAGGDVEGGFALLGAGVVDHLVDDQGTGFGQREGRIVGEGDADGAVGARFHQIALEDGGAVGGRDLGAVGAGDGDRALEGGDLADGFSPGRRRLGEFHDLTIG